jgi:hypothetical protein
MFKYTSMKVFNINRQSLDSSVFSNVYLLNKHQDVLLVHNPLEIPCLEPIILAAYECEWTHWYRSYPIKQHTFEDIKRVIRSRNSVSEQNKRRRCETNQFYLFVTCPNGVNFLIILLYMYEMLS